MAGVFSLDKYLTVRLLVHSRMIVRLLVPV